MKRIKQMHSRYRQQGVAAIMFAIMLPVLFMFIALGVDGAHFLRASARVGDAVEVASLALSSAGRMGDGDVDKNARRKIAESYIHALLPDIDKKDIQVTSSIQVCEENSTSADCGTDFPEPRFIQYQVNGTVTIGSLFPTLNHELGFGREVSPERLSLSRQYIAEAIDVVLVVDFSKTMDDPWNDDNGKIKITMLKNIVKKYTQRIENYTSADEFTHKNTFSLVPFNLYTTDKNVSAPNGCTVTQFKFTQEDHNFYNIYIDYQKTMEELFNPKPCNGGLKLGTFNTIEPTSVAADINKIDDMTAAYRTASVEGIIRGAQLLMNISTEKKTQDNCS